MLSREALVAKVRDHLGLVTREPQTRLDAKLLEQLSGTQLSIREEEKRELVNQISQLLLNIQQNPEPATKLAESLVSSFSYADVQSINPPVDLVAGVKAHSPSVQLLSLRLIELAAQKASDVAIVAGNLDLVRTLVDTWLRATDIAVSARAGDLITSLLLADAAPVSMQGLMQRRVFKDRGVYELFYSLPSLQTVGKDGQPSKKDKTIAQGRLLGFLCNVRYLEDVWESQIPEIEESFGLKTGQGLMQFASLYMVDKNDILLERTKIDFFTDLVRGTEGGRWIGRERNFTENFLEEDIAAVKVNDLLHIAGIHSKLVSLYATPELHDPIDVSFLRSSAAKYVAEYILHNRNRFMSDESFKRIIFKRLHRSLDEVQLSQWARNDGPSEDLEVLVSVPYPALAAEPSCLLLLPTKPPSADVFRCLEMLFSGLNPLRKLGEVLSFRPTSQQSLIAAVSPNKEEDARADAWAARQMYLHYIAAKPQFWANTIAASSVTALKDTAVAGISLMTAIIRAKWEVDAPEGLETPASTTAASEGSEAPSTGLAAVLNPAVLDHVVPFLMKGPSEGRGASLLGSDTTAAEYHVAEAKLRMTDALKQGIEELVKGLKDADNDRALLMELAAGLGVLLRQGISNRANEPGAEVGTMEL